MNNRIKSQIAGCLVPLLLLIIPPLPGYSQKDKLYTYPSTDKFINDFSLSVGGSVLVYTDGTAIRVVESGDTASARKFSGGHTDRVFAVDISPDSSLIASGGRDGLVVIRDRISGEIVKRIETGTDEITALHFSYQGEYLFIGTMRGRFICYDLKGGRIEFENHVNIRLITSVDVSPAGGIVAVGGADKVLYIIDSAKGNIISRFEDHHGWIRDVHFSPDGTRLASAGDDKTVNFYNANNILNISKMPVKVRSLNRINSVDVYSDNLSLACGLDNGILTVETVFSRYIYRSDKPILKVRFVSGPGGRIDLIIATYGSGLIQVPLSSMKLNTDRVK